MNVVNLCPHDVVVCGKTYPKSDTPARVSEISMPVGSFAGIQLVTKDYGEVYNLPCQKADTLYIVSAMVRLACPDRADLASPGDQVRDDNGHILGVTNLVVNR